MADTQFQIIDGQWALAYDTLQWVLQRRGGIDKRNGREVWSGTSFVSSTKAVLARCMRQKGVPDDAVQRALSALPDTFREFISRPLAGLGSGVAPTRRRTPRAAHKTPPKTPARPRKEVISHDHTQAHPPDPREPAAQRRQAALALGRCAQSGHSFAATATLPP